jgi:hypothetical protein
MPFLAIVYVRDRTAADRIVERYAHGDAGRIVGLYNWPKKDELTCKGFCATRRGMGWSRHREGHMICAVCGSRHIQTRRRLVGALLDYLGVNLMKRSTTPPAFRNPEGWDA